MAKGGVCQPCLLTGWCWDMLRSPWGFCAVWCAVLSRLEYLGIVAPCCPMIDFGVPWHRPSKGGIETIVLWKQYQLTSQWCLTQFPSGLVGMFGFSDVKRSAPVSKRDHSGPGRASHAGSLRAIDVASFTKFELYWMDAGSRCNRQCKGFGASHTLWESISYASLWKTPTVEDRRGRRRETERQVEGEVADRLLPYLYRTLRRDCWDVRCNSQIGIQLTGCIDSNGRGCWKNRTSALRHGIRVHSTLRQSI